MGHPLRCGGLVNPTMRFAPWPRPYIGAARRLRELRYKPAVAQIHFRLAAFAAPFAARVHVAVDILIRAASIISFPLGALRGGRPNSLLTGNFSKKEQGIRTQLNSRLFSLIKWSRLGEGQAPTSFPFLGWPGPSPAMTNWQGDRVRCAHPSYCVWPLHFWSQKLVSRVLRYFVPGACRWKKRFQATVIS